MTATEPDETTGLVAGGAPAEDLGAGSGSAAEPDASPSTVEQALASALDELHGGLVGLDLPLATPGVEGARADQLAAIEQLETYLLPRLSAPAAPLLVVVGGSTGAGKSTLVNSLVGEQVSVPGVLRPTTRAPVLVHHPSDAAWFAPAPTTTIPTATAATSVRGSQGYTPDSLGRYEGLAVAAGVRTGLRVVASEAVPAGLALLDAPDVDSVEEANRALADRLLAAADLWLFVTTAARYADAVPWTLLRGAAARHAQVALVVDRVDPGAEVVVDDLRRLMDANALGDAPLFVVPETGLDAGLLPEDAVAQLAAWLSGLAEGPARRAVALATRDGVVNHLVRRAVALAGAADEQVVADGRLRAVVAERYAEAAARVSDATSDGVMLRGEVLARWQELVGTGELFRQLEAGIGRLRDRVTAFVRGRPSAEPRVEEAIVSGLEAVLLDAADEAAVRVHAVWRTDPAGAPLVAGTDLARSSAGLRARAAQEVRAWQGDVLALVREQGASRRGTARYLSFGVNAAGVALMVVLFASTGGLTGGEVVIAGGTAVVAQRLLEAVFGDDAVRRLTTSARRRLDERVSELLRSEASRYTGVLDGLATSGGGDALRAAAHRVERAAHDERSARARPEVGARLVGRTGSGLRGADRYRGESPAAGPPVPGRGFWRRVLRRGGGAR